MKMALVGLLTLGVGAFFVVGSQGGDAKEVTLKGKILCARCVEPVPQSLEGDFDLIFRPTGVDAETGEHAITPDETEIGYYEESGLLLEDVVREQVLLSLPPRTLCKADCQGLCPRCGQNRNHVPCSCDQTPSDPRWNALAGLADKLEVKH